MDINQIVFFNFFYLFFFEKNKHYDIDEGITEMMKKITKAAIILGILILLAPVFSETGIVNFFIDVDVEVPEDGKWAIYVNNGTIDLSGGEEEAFAKGDTVPVKRISTRVMVMKSRESIRSKVTPEKGKINNDKSRKKDDV